MIRHLLTIIWNQRKSNIWILAELFIGSVCLWFVVDYMLVLTGIVNVPLGYDIAHTYRIDMEERFPGSDGYIDPALKETTTGQDLLVVMERIGKYPGIEAVSLSKSSQPYVATPYSSSMRFEQLYYNDTIGVSAQKYTVTPSFFEVFRNKENSNENQRLSNALQANTVILAEDTEFMLMQGESAVYKEIRIGHADDTRMVEAICTPVRWNEYFKSYPCFYVLLPEADVVEDVNLHTLPDYELCIRVTPGKDVGFVETFIRDIAPQLLYGNLYLADVRPTSIIRRAIVAPEESNIMVRTILFIFIIINIFLGISGTFLFRTQHRRSEIGLRMALGSSRYNLQLLMIGEGLLLLTLAIIPAVVVDLNMGLAELINLNWEAFTPARFLMGIAVTYLIMAIMIISGIWYPARNTMKIQPAVVLHEE